MRLLVDSLIALMLVGILSGVLLYHRLAAWEIRQLQQAHLALAQMQEQVLYREALGMAGEDERKFPPAISPLWFSAGLPVNPWVPGRQPWIDLAGSGDWGDDPPDPVLTRSTQAQFWYNANRGLVRARVQRQLSDQATLTLYNRVNGTFLRALPTESSTRKVETMSYRFVAAAGNPGNPGNPGGSLGRPAAEPTLRRPR